MGRGKDVWPRVRRLATDAEKAHRLLIRQQANREKAMKGFAQLFSGQGGTTSEAASSGITSGRDTEPEATEAMMSGEDADD
eukprot:5244082-Prymnesium_polylepis.1